MNLRICAHICRLYVFVFFFSSRRRHTRYWRDWSSDVCSSDLLAALARREGRIVSRAELYETVWGAPMRADERSVDVYVHKLRSKLAEALPEIGRASCRERV